MESTSTPTKPQQPKVDILTVLSKLSNDEVFTPPSIANDMLDLLPKDLWHNKEARFLDPFTKSGVFLREITLRLLDGLADQIPDKQERLDHILKKQVFGVATSELTAMLARRSLYGNKAANHPTLSLTGVFDDDAGNIILPDTAHIWDKKGNCRYCGVSKAVWDRGDANEKYAYPFLHSDHPDKDFFPDMKFDVIIGNPPYQMEDEGSSRSSKPLYNLFALKAKSLNPDNLIMIIPARWYAGGKGLDEFRAVLLNEKKIKALVDYQNSSDVFKGVDIAGGICYFHWQSNYNGLCRFVSKPSNDNDAPTERILNDYPIFVRQTKALTIINKVVGKYSEGDFMDSTVSQRKPFSLPTNYEPRDTGIKCWFIQKIGLQFANPSDVSVPERFNKKWKFLAPKAPIAGQTDFSKPISFYYSRNTIIAKPDEICTESFIILGAFDTEKEVKNFRSYVFTKLFRFLLLQAVVSQDVISKCFCFIPDLKVYPEPITDEYLRELWGITDDEWDYVSSRIKDTE